MYSGGYLENICCKDPRKEEISYNSVNNLMPIQNSNFVNNDLVSPKYLKLPPLEKVKVETQPKQSTKLKVTHVRKHHNKFEQKLNKPSKRKWEVKFVKGKNLRKRNKSYVMLGYRDYLKELGIDHLYTLKKQYRFTWQKTVAINIARVRRKTVKPNTESLTGRCLTINPKGCITKESKDTLNQASFQAGNVTEKNLPTTESSKQFQLKPDTIQKPNKNCYKNRNKNDYNRIIPPSQSNQNIEKISRQKKNEILCYLDLDNLINLFRTEGPSNIDFIKLTEQLSEENEYNVLNSVGLQDLSLKNNYNLPASIETKPTTDTYDEKPKHTSKNSPLLKKTLQMSKESLLQSRLHRKPFNLKTKTGPHTDNNNNSPLKPVKFKFVDKQTMYQSYEDQEYIFRNKNPPSTDGPQQINFNKLVHRLILNRTTTKASNHCFEDQKQISPINSSQFSRKYFTDKCSNSFKLQTTHAQNSYNNTELERSYLEDQIKPANSTAYYSKNFYKQIGEFGKSNFKGRINSQGITISEKGECNFKGEDLSENEVPGYLQRYSKKKIVNNEIHLQQYGKEKCQFPQQFTTSKVNNLDYNQSSPVDQGQIFVRKEEQNILNKDFSDNEIPDYLKIYNNNAQINNKIPLYLQRYAKVRSRSVQPIINNMDNLVYNTNKTSTSLEDHNIFSNQNERSLQKDYSTLAKQIIVKAIENAKDTRLNGFLNYVLGRLKPHQKVRPWEFEHSSNQTNDQSDHQTNAYKTDNDPKN